MKCKKKQFAIVHKHISRGNCFYWQRPAEQANDTVWTEKIVWSAKIKIASYFPMCKVSIYTLASMLKSFICTFCLTIHFLDFK